MLNRLRGTWPAIAAAAALLVGGAVLLSTRLGQPEPSPAPTPTPAISVVAGDLTIFGEGDAGPARDELVAVLTDVYERAFLPPIPVPTPPAPDATPPPGPPPRPPLEELFTSRAGSVAAGNDTFRPAPDERITRGVLTFTGLLTVDEHSSAQALLDVDLDAHGFVERDRDETPDPDAAPPAVRLRQVGQLLLVHTEAGWRVAGFDLRLEADRQIGPARPRASARWMP